MSLGDRILVQKQGAPEGQWFEGGVHVVRREEVGLRFHRSFAWTPEQKYNVRFKLNRHPIRRQHQALDTAFGEERVLFPRSDDTARGGAPKNIDPRLELVNTLIANNPRQLQAVNSIVNQAPGAMPFVIFGPCVRIA